MRHRDVLVYLVFARSRHQPVNILARLLEIVLAQPVLSHRGFEPDVVAPREPRIAIEDVSHIVKSDRRLLMLSVTRVIDPTIDSELASASST
jgi:hypothetical protein